MKKPTLKGVCAKCSYNIRKEFVQCSICDLKLHRICSEITNDAIFKALDEERNIVFNCDSCLRSKPTNVNQFQHLNSQIDELKLMVEKALLVMSYKQVQIFTQSDFKSVVNSLGNMAIFGKWFKMKLLGENIFCRNKILEKNFL